MSYKEHEGWKPHCTDGHQSTLTMRSLMLNLFARASEGPLTTEDLRKMSTYSDSIKEQRAQDYMAQRRRRTSPKTTDKP